MTAARTQSHRVVVTGMGVVTPLGNDVRRFTSSLLEGRSGIAAISHFDASGLPTQIAGEAPLPDEVPLGDRKIAFALEAARQAMLQSAWSPKHQWDTGSGVCFGVGLELFSMPDLVKFRAQGSSLPAPLHERLSFMQTPSDLAVHLLAKRYGLAAPPSVHVSACAAGTDAIGAAYQLIARGKRRAMLAGGTDSMLNPLGVAGFCALGATSTRNLEPALASRPFDRSRDGFVMGEGAAALWLERLSDAEARGAPILAEISGYGTSLDAYKISDPHPEGYGAYVAMSRALGAAKLKVTEIDAINAHGTGTPKNDRAETLALKRLLGPSAKKIPISATKSMIGHLISAAGAVEAVAAIDCMAQGQVHPTINLNTPDPDCDLDYVAGQARKWPQRHVLSTSYGFGGQNSALVISHPSHTGATC